MGGLKGREGRIGRGESEFEWYTADETGKV